MRLRKITLFNFKNYSEATFEVGEGLNCVLGENGVGKTNLLDAIYFLCLTKSAFHSSDQNLIRMNQDLCSVSGLFDDAGSDVKINARFGIEQKKVISTDGEEYEKYSDHIGRITAIMVHPHDLDYVRMNSELRRKLIDGMISQSDNKYLSYLLKHNRLIRQRNTALKQLRESGKRNDTLIDSYDSKLFEYIPYLSSVRTKYVEELTPNLNDIYKDLGEGREEVEIVYNSKTTDKDFRKLFESSRNQDYESCRTSLGIHKDDFDFVINGNPLKAYGSQGQQKSFMLSLKLSQITLLSQPPILLLDDLFDRLDTRRITRLMKYIETLGLQALITDARPDRVEALLKEMKLKSRNIYI